MQKMFLKDFIDILFPKSCVICRKTIKINVIDNLICQECWGKIKENIPPFCNRCGRHLENIKRAKICPRCQRVVLHFDRAFSPCIYDGVLKDLIHKFKYENKDYLGNALSRLLIDFVKEYELPLRFIDAVVPVPLHPGKMRQREFNQADILGQALAKEFKIEFMKEGLCRIRDTKSQTELTDMQRWDNIKNCFAVNNQNKIKGKNVLLVDDILTTGATCSEAAATLKQAGAGIVFVLTLAN